jgi:CheY-like chemotaxis protein
VTSVEKSRILLIDDDRSLLVTLRDFLRFEGYEVVTAASAEEGLGRLDTVTPDLIVLDMSMPGMGGMGFLERIMRDGRPAHPVLVLTARSQMAEYFANVAVDGFVAKPCDPNDLLMEISRIVFLTRGKVRQEVPAVAHRSVLLGEDETAARNAMAEALRAAGCTVHAVESGPAVLESAILQKPDVIVLNAAMAKAEEGAVSRMLSEMSNTRAIPLVVYGRGCETAAMHSAGGVARVCTSAPAPVVEAVVKALAD